MSKFFTISTQTTADDLRRQYKELCKQHHPDRGGSDAVQAQINIEYQQVLRKIAEREKQKENIVSYERLMQEIEHHWQGIMKHVRDNKGLYQSMMKEVGIPLVMKVVPKQYQWLAIGLYNLFEPSFYKTNFKYGRK